MLTIQIKNGDNKVVAVINDIFSLQIEDEVNKGGKLKMKIPTEKRMQKQPLKKAYKISVMYGLKIGQIVKLFDGYITDVIIKTDTIEIQAENWLTYLQNRIIRGDKNYENQTISSIVSGIFTELNTAFELPITLGLNDCNTSISNKFSKGTSFYDILKYCREAEENLIVRVQDGVLEVSKNTGEILDGIWEYDVKSSRATNLSDWSWKDSMDKFYSYMMNNNSSETNTEFQTETKLMFEKYGSDLALTLPTGNAIPSVSISRDTDWWTFNIGDRKQIRLDTGYSRLEIEYLGLIQSRKITINANGGIKTEIKVSEGYTAETNILDLVLTNLRKK